MSSLGKFGPGFNTGLESNMPSAGQMMTSSAASAFPQDGTFQTFARDFSKIAAFSPSQMPGFATKQTMAQTTLGTDAITTRLITSLFTSPLDHQYSDFLKNAFVFSIFDALAGATRMLHLNMLNAKLRDDFEAYVNTLNHAQTPTVMPSQIGIGAKRGVALMDAPRVAVDSNSGIHNFEQAKEAIRFLGCMPAPEDNHRGLSSSNSRRNTLETVSVIQVAGRIRYVTNIFGKVNTGDYLTFHMTRINNLNEDSKITSYRDFGPIQIVPVASSTAHTSFGSGSGIHDEWRRVQKQAQSLGAVNVPLAFGSEAYNPFVARIGSNRSSAFSSVRPIRSLAADRGVDALHYGPGEVFIRDADGKVSEKCLYTKLEPNVVFQIGMVDIVHPRNNYKGLSKQRLKELLLQPSGKGVCESTAAKIDIHLATHVQ